MTTLVIPSDKKSNHTHKDAIIHALLQGMHKKIKGLVFTKKSSRMIADLTSQKCRKFLINLDEVSGNSNIFSCRTIVEFSERDQHYKINERVAC
jgi:hypothetical protein